ncbi:hypothetical protein [Porphyrobacter sp. YT40]|uniref:hypothetical protein n=1 Tax=Porphyrobacter sp. YT40 TaxID=2547601 RepID=UPI0011440299|nr:hypothetical protein [Porphyrobacter sp. YT40]QDH35568.1 hypothetical protein E2E27_15350 [Porphyrobacter sp. YT40]
MGRDLGSVRPRIERGPPGNGKPIKSFLQTILRYLKNHVLNETLMENDKRLPIKEKTVKKLFAYSGNQCAFKDCSRSLVDNGGTMIGKIAHIRSPKPKGPRYDASWSSEDCRHEKNLLILCSDHHDAIDDEDREEEFPTEMLEAWKESHEARFKRAERALIDRYADLTALSEPTYPKTLKGLGTVLNLEEMIDCPDDIRGITEFIDRLKNLPHDARGFAYNVSKRMRNLQTHELLVQDVARSFNISENELREMLEILDAHGIGGHERDFEDRIVVVISDRYPGGSFRGGECNPFHEILAYCEATGTDPNCFLEDLDFARFDVLPSEQ